MKKEKVQNQKRGRNRLVTIIWLLIIFSLLGLGWYHISHLDKNFYLHYTNPTSVGKLTKQAKNFSKQDKLEYDIIYKAGCKDCKEVLPVLQKRVPKLNKENPVLFVNAAKHDISQALRKEDIHSTPTFLIKYRGLLLYQYSGTNKSVITQILSGKNPDTGIAFSLNTASAGTYRDDTGKHKIIKHTSEVKHVFYNL